MSEKIVQLNEKVIKGHNSATHFRFHSKSKYKLYS